ncbi:MAG TPA: hypothetical protein VIJ94_06480 [Caulobacteraceae bacterium]
MGIFDRLGALGGTDAGQALGAAHDHFQSRINTHGHFGRAFIESLAELCRNHPNLVGVAVGVLVEQLLVHEKHHHDIELAEEARAEREGRATGSPIKPLPRAAPHHTPHHLMRFSRIHPFRIAMEVFGALILLKFSFGIARIFSRQRAHSKASLATVARIRLFSASFAAYFIAKALRSHEVSASRNALAMFFGTRALQPLLRPDFRRPSAEPPPPRPPAEPGFSLAPEMQRPEEHEHRMFH